MLGFPILYCKGMRPMMFQLSGFYCIWLQGPSGSQASPCGYLGGCQKLWYLLGSYYSTAPNI